MFPVSLKSAFIIHLLRIWALLPDGSESRVLCTGCLRSEIWGEPPSVIDFSKIFPNGDHTSPRVRGWTSAFAKVRRVRGLFCNNSRSSWVTVGFGRPSSGGTPPALDFCGDRLGSSCVGDRRDWSGFRGIVIGVGLLSRLRGPLVAVCSWMVGFRGERGERFGEDNNSGRSRSIGDIGGG